MVFIPFCQGQILSFYIAFQPKVRFLQCELIDGGDLFPIRSQPQEEGYAILQSPGVSLLAIPLMTGKFLIEVAHQTIPDVRSLILRHQPGAHNQEEEPNEYDFVHAHQGT